MHDCIDALLESRIVEPRDLRKAERRPIAAAAILERPDQLAVA